MAYLDNQVGFREL